MNTSSKDLVSYVVLSYNHKKYIDKTIESIINQNYQNIEIIVVDDGSTDGSVDLLLEMRDKYGFTLISQENSGVVAALNRGISEAQGDYIVPHASDDISHPERTNEQIASFGGDPLVGFVVAGIRKISEDGEVVEPWIHSGRVTYTFEDFVAGRGRAIAVSCMYRGDAIRQIMPLDQTLSFEDVQLYWRVTGAGYKCVFDSGVLAVDYRIVKGSLGRSNMLRHHQSFIRFISSYREEPWYFDVEKRANSGLFSVLAEESRTRALLFLIKNIGSISFSNSLRGIGKILLPRSVMRAIKKKH